MGGPAYVNGEAVEEFGNFYPCDFEAWDINTRFTSVEQAFQYGKSKDPAYQASILACIDPKQAWRLGRKCESLDPRWEHLKVIRMFSCMYERFRQNNSLRAKLIATYPNSITFQHDPDKKDEWDEYNAIALETVRAIFHREQMHVNVSIGLGFFLGCMFCFVIWVSST